jgi:predicted DNA-binding transcriptional regulator AlpA
MSTVDVRASEVARSQYGRATRDQLRSTAGVSRSTITRRLRDGVWTEPVPGVIDLGTHAVSWRAQVVEVVLAAGDPAWASHLTAAHLHRFLDVPRPETVDVLVPRARHHKVGEHELHATRAIGLDEITERHGIACTTRARTLLDLASTSRPGDLERWLAQATRKDATLPRDVVELCDRHRHVPGRRRLLDAVGRLPDGAAELGSPLEVLGVQELLALGAPPFEVQYTVRDADRNRVKRVDVAWPERRTVLEFDGVAYHDLTDARAADELVRARMRALGWTVEVVRRADLGGAALPRIVRQLGRSAS